MSDDKPKVASLEARREERRAARLTSPDQARLIESLEELLAQARTGHIWGLGLVVIRRPETDADATHWDTRVEFIGLDQCPFTFLGAAHHLTGMAERAVAGLPCNSDDVAGPPPRGG